MVRTLVLHDREGADAAGLLALLLGPAMTVPLSSGSVDYSGAVACALVLAPAGLTPAGLERLARSVPAHLPVALWLLPASGAEERFRAAAEAFGDRLALAATVPSDPESFAAAGVALRRRFLRGASGMPAEELRAMVFAGLAARNTCTLCTGHGDEVRATPIEYLLLDDRLYLLSEGGEKFAHLLFNPRVSVAVYDPYASMDALFGLQLTGRATRVPPSSAEFGRVVAARGLSQSRLSALPVLVHLVRVDLEEAELVSSGAKRLGYATRQRIRL
ncbi:hypothetical protein DSECCO2_376980 [anaerobic digester metagenome]